MERTMHSRFTRGGKKRPCPLFMTASAARQYHSVDTSLRARARSNHRPVQVRHLQQVGHPNLAYVNRVLQIAKAALLALKVAWIWIAIQVARLLGDQKALIAYLLATGELLGDLGRWEASHTYTAEAKRIAEQLGDSYEVAHAEFKLGCAYFE